jgi:hypothetical protein
LSRQVHDDRPFTVMTYVSVLTQRVSRALYFRPTQNVVSACADPHKSRTETSVFFARHWGDNFLPGASVPPPPAVAIGGATRANSRRQRHKAEQDALTHIVVPYLRTHMKVGHNCTKFQYLFSNYALIKKRTSLLFRPRRKQSTNRHCQA